MPMISGIYAIINGESGALYVGSAKSVWHRLEDHRKHLQAEKHSNRHLQRAWKKYGESAFHFTVIEECPPTELVLREQRWIDELHPEYNIALSARNPMLGRKHMPETRAKISAAVKGHKGRGPWAKGYRHTFEARANMSAARKGKGLTLETRAKMSVTLKGRQKGKKHTPEARANMSAAHRGKKRTPEARAKVSAGLKAFYLRKKNKLKDALVEKGENEIWQLTPWTSSAEL